jgi:hypothetical protein
VGGWIRHARGGTYHRLDVEGEEEEGQAVLQLHVRQVLPQADARPALRFRVCVWGVGVCVHEREREMSCGSGGDGGLCVYVCVWGGGGFGRWMTRMHTKPPTPSHPQTITPLPPTWKAVKMKADGLGLCRWRSGLKASGSAHRDSSRPITYGANITQLRAGMLWVVGGGWWVGRMAVGGGKWLVGWPVRG